MDKSDERYTKFYPGESSWKGRLPRSEKCTNSFKHFVAVAKSTKAGKDHLKQHHGGYGL